MKLGADVCHHCGRDQHPAESNTPDRNAAAVKEIAARLERAGMANKGERLRATVRAMDLVRAGETVDDAVAAVTAQPLSG